MVMLPAAVAVEPDAFASALAELGGGAVQEVEAEGDVLTFKLDGAVGAIALMPAPIPWSEIERPAQTALMWPDAASVLRDHRAHLIVTLFSRTGTVVDRKMRLTRVAAAAAQVTQALGVYWGDGPSVHSLEDFVEAATNRSVESPPMHTWLGLSITKPTPDRISLLTFGMEKFGHPNLLIDGPNGTASVGFLFDFASYLITGNVTIRDGDTVGQSATQRIAVHHRPSPIDATATILAIDLPADFGE